MPLFLFGLWSRKYFFGLKSPLIKSFIIQYNKHIITNADNKSNITFPFIWLIFHCYAANIVNVIDIVLFLPLIYLEIAKLTFAAAEVVEKAREAFAYDGG